MSQPAVSHCPWEVVHVDRVWSGGNLYSSLQMASLQIGHSAASSSEEFSGPSAQKPSTTEQFRHKKKTKQNKTKTNQPTSHVPANQPTNQPNKRWTNEPVSQLTDQPKISQPTTNKRLRQDSPKTLEMGWQSCLKAIHQHRMPNTHLDTTETEDMYTDDPETLFAMIWRETHRGWATSSYSLRGWPRTGMPWEFLLVACVQNGTRCKWWHWCFYERFAYRHAQWCELDFTKSSVHEHEHVHSHCDNIAL